MSSIPVFNKAGQQAGEVELPSVFQTGVRTDLIRKAVKVARANARQPYGANPVAGERHATASVGKGKGASRVPRLTQGRVAALAPNVVGGRRAHAPYSRTSYKLKMNKTERRLAIASALAATAQGDLVAARGHKVDGLQSFPVVVEDDVVLGKTQETKKALESIGLQADLQRAHEGRHIRAGQGKLRGRRFRQPKTVLVVVADGTADSVANLRGVDVVLAKDLGAEHLAPGGDAGRLTVFTKSALQQIQEAF